MMRTLLSNTLTGILLSLLTLTVVQAAEDDGDVIRLDGVTIQGNSENPNVLFVNAWQPPPGTGRLYQAGGLVPVTS